MQTRSPLVFWLLLAATLSIDAVAATLIIHEPQSSVQYSIIALHALILSQMSIVCVLSAISHHRTFWRVTTPLSAAVIASAVSGWLLPQASQLGIMAIFISQLGYYGLNAVILLAAVWLIQWTKFWARRTGVPRAWQFSLIQVLVAMTLVAVLSVLMRKGTLIVGDRPWITVVFVAANVLLIVMIFWLWNLSWHWVLRAASAFAVAVVVTAIILGIVLLDSQIRNLRVGFPQLAFAFVTIYGGYFLIQTLMLSAWFAWGQIVPPHATHGAVVDSLPQ